MYGLHINSDPNKIISELDKYKKTCKVIQMFVNINKKYNNIYEQFKLKLKELSMNVVIHASYTINIAQEWSEYSWWITQLIEEIKIADKISAKYIVIHLGKKLDLDDNTAMNNMYSSLLYIHNQTKKLSIKLLLETSSGQGSEMCTTITSLSVLMNKFLNSPNELIKNRFGVCVDTCHIFSAGYAINNKDETIKYINEFEEKIKISNIKLLHLNDSKNGVGSNVDRHENINNGYIGITGLEPIIKLCFKLNIPIILETPDDNIKNDLDILHHLEKHTKNKN